MRTVGLAAAILWSPITPAAAQMPGPPPGALIFGCGSPAKVEADALALLSAASSSPAEQQAHLDAARAAIEKVAEIQRDALAGQPVEPPYEGASRYAALVASAPSSELAELYRRAAEDQFIRSHSEVIIQSQSWAAHFSQPARAYAYYVLGSQGCGVDEANTQWLKEHVSQSGWFTISEYGAAADSAAWLLVQHADRDVAFQAEVLSILEPLVAAEETRPISYAYLYDRVAVNSKRPQRYGTQGGCTAGGTWEPREVERPEQVDERRTAIGLEPMAAYKARFTCPNAPRS